MPQYKVLVYNDESNMLYSEQNLYAADEETAKTTAVEEAEAESGYTAEQNQAAKPRFRVAATEV